MAKEEVEEEVIPAEPVDGRPFLMSPDINKIAPALIAAQKKLKNPDKNAKNPHFGNRYADLGATIEAAKEALHGQDIGFTQVFVPAPYGSVGLTTLLVHGSGQFIGGTVFVPLDRDNAQGLGSAATYARRYGIQSIIGMVAEDDDDGNAASPERATPSAKPGNGGQRKGLFRK